MFGRWWDTVRTGYWFVPLLCVATAVASAIGLIALDRYLQDRGVAAWTYAGGPQNASDTLTTIASSMITFTGLVFSITIVALQLTSSQFSPRALRTFLRDRVSQFALGVFVATFAYAFTALSAVRVAGGDDTSFVPAITITGAFALVAASITMFVHFIHHTAQSLRVVNIIERIAGETRQSIDDTYPATTRPGNVPAVPAVLEGEVAVITSPAAGVVTDVALDRLAVEAAEHAAIVEVLVPVGEFVCEGAPLLRVGWLATRAPDDGDDDDSRWHRHVVLGVERTMRRDPGFGLRQLVDIAERALSPGVNDPTTAVQCLDRIHDALRILTTRPIPAVVLGTRDGVVRAWIPTASYEDLVRLGLEEIARWGRDSPRVTDRIARIVDDLETVAADGDRLATLAEQRRRLLSGQVTAAGRGTTRLG